MKSILILLALLGTAFGVVVPISSTTPVIADGEYSLPYMRTGTKVIYQLSGTFGGGTATIGYINPLGTFTAFTGGTNIFTAPGSAAVMLPNGPEDGKALPAITLAGATSPAITITLTKIREGTDLASFGFATVADYSDWTPASAVASLGDSITDLDTYNSATNRIFYHTWLNWTNIFLGQRITWVANSATNEFNFGVSGNTAEQILARVPDVLATAADTVLVMAGTNNLHSGSDTPAVLAPKVAAIWDAVIAGGKQVLATEILPMTDSTKNKSVAATNRLLKIAADSRGIPFVVWGDSIRDGPYAKTDLFTAQGLGDIGLHPGPFGAVALGRIAAAQLDSYIQPVIFPIPASGLLTAGGAWVTRNAYMSGGSGSTVPTDWAVAEFSGAGTPAVSKVAVTAGGQLTQNWLRVIIPSGPLTGGTGIQAYQAAGVANNGLVEGDWIRPVARIRLNRNSNFSRFQFSAIFAGDAGVVSYGLFDNASASNVLTTTVHDGEITGIVMGPKVQVTQAAIDGLSYCGLTVYGYGEVSVSQMGLIKTTAPE